MLTAAHKSEALLFEALLTLKSLKKSLAGSWGDFDGSWIKDVKESLNSRGLSCVC